jgi:GntR family transcriptional regulator, transcriptional repressor for pyruvate dehydrogenase complex
VTIHKKIERTSVPDQIFEQLKQSIIAGTWRPGEALPPETQLAEEFGVSRLSVRVAIKKLQTYGLVEVRMGEGTFVIEFSPSVFLKGLSPILANPKNALEMIEFRKALEVECLKLASKRAGKADLDALEAIFKEYWEALDSRDYDKVLSLDYRFHHQVFLMSKNRLFKDIYESMSEAFFLHYDENERLYEKSYGHNTARTDPHGLVLEALKGGDLQAAIAAFTKMMDELVAVYERLDGEGAARA